MITMDYVARFTELARFTDDYVATNMAKVRRFENGLNFPIRGKIVCLRLQDMDSMVGTALTIERERSRMLRALGMRVLVARGRRVSLLLVRERSRGLLVHKGSRAATIWARNRSGCYHTSSGILLTVDLRVIDMSEFDVILGMDWLKTYRVVIDCECRRVTAYTQDGSRVVFQGDKHDIFSQTVYQSRCQGQLVGWLASLTLEDEARPDLDLP